MGSEISIEDFNELETDGVVNLLFCSCTIGEDKKEKYMTIVQQQKIKGADISGYDCVASLIIYLREIGITEECEVNEICDLLAEMDHNYCRHIYLESWDGTFHCVDCKGLVDEPHDRIQLENDLEVLVRSRDEADMAARMSATGCSREEAAGYLSSHRGVTIQFLVDFTRNNNLWEVPTWKVRRDHILPATEAGRCRYAELPVMADKVGPASTFVSHTWSAPWGDLVAAVCDGADLTRRVWIDVFAVRQWPGSEADLDFRSTIQCCSSFVLVCTSLAEVARLSWSRYDRYMLSEETKKKIAFFRVWCLVEIQTAVLAPEMAIIMKGGSHETVTQVAADIEGGLADFRFVSNKSMLEKMKHVIDVANADASVQSDKERILREVEEGPGGAGGLNRIIKGTVGGALACCGDSMVQCAACGDAHAVDAIFKDERSITRVAAGGYYVLLSKLIENGVDINIQDDDDMTSLMWACYCGHKECVQVLLRAGADILPTNPRDGMTAFLYACDGGHVECVEYLLERDIDNMLPSQISIDGTTAAMFTCFRGRKKDVTDLCKLGPPPEGYGDDGSALNVDENYTRCLQLVLAAGRNSPGFDINKKNDMFMTALMCASVGGHIVELKMLLAAGADVHIRNDQGVGAAVIAREHRHIDCHRLLSGEFDIDGSSTSSCIPFAKCVVM